MLSSSIEDQARNRITYVPIATIHSDGQFQRRYGHEMLTERALFFATKKGTLSQQFMTHVTPPLGEIMPMLSRGLLRSHEEQKGLQDAF